MEISCEFQGGIVLLFYRLTAFHWPYTERKGEKMYSIEQVDQIRGEMQKFDRGSAERIQHFTKVHSFAAQIGRAEKIDSETLFILELTALLHDIGIGPAEEKYGFCNGKLQEEEGPTYAKTLLEKYNIPEKVIARVCYLIAHHHTYEQVDGMDYRILLEADFLVNLYENNVSKDGVLSAFKQIFATETGKNLCQTMFDF